MNVEKKDLILEPRNKYNYDSDPRKFYDTIIIGAGIVGFSTAMYAARLGMKTLIIGESFGGTIITTDIVENWPGIVSVTGIKLAKLVENHARDYDIDILRKKVIDVEAHTQDKNKGRHFKVSTKDKSFISKTIIFATGTQVRKLGVPGENELSGRGVSYCALCDGPLYKDKTVAVVGGSDSAVKEAILLTEYAKKVYIIYRGEEVHPEPVNLDKMEEKIKQGKIEIINNTNITEIKGDKLITEVIFDKSYKGKKEFKLEGLFVYIGHIPLNDLAKKLKIKLNKKGEIIINKNSETNVDNVYAAGDIADREFKQAITGAAEGVVAAYHAYQCINKGACVLPVEGDGGKDESKK